MLSHDGASAAAMRAFTDNLTTAIRRYNVAALCDPAKRNMYEYCEPEAMRDRGGPEA